MYVQDVILEFRTDLSVLSIDVRLLSICPVMVCYRCFNETILVLVDYIKVYIFVNNHR